MRQTSNKENQKSIIHSHGRNYYDINGLLILAVNEQSAQAQHDRIKAHQAMRLAKSNAKVNYAA